MGAKRKRMQTSTHIWRQDDNCARATFIKNLAKNELAFNFRKLEALKGKIKEIEGKQNCLQLQLENKMLDYSVAW